MKKPLIKIEYCSKCRWLTRASWIAQELLSTFSDEIEGIYLIPSNIAGILKISCNKKIIWERDKNSGIPQIKFLKQNIRDIVSPKKKLGHIDN